MGHLGTIVVFDIRYGDGEGGGDLSDQTDERNLTITCEESKATVAGWSFLDKYIIAGHEDGTVSQYDAKVRFHILTSLERFRFANTCVRNPDRGAARLRSSP